MIELPWPPKTLSPNNRACRFAKARDTKKYRRDCYLCAKAANVRVSSESLTLALTFCPPDRRRRDLDNMLASAKGLIDAVADALGVDDQHFSLLLDRGEPVMGGAVKVKVLPKD